MRIGTAKKLEISHQYSFLPATDAFFGKLIAKAKGYYKDVILTLQSFNDQIGKTRKKGSYAKSHMVNVKRQLLNCPCIKVMEELGTWSFRVQIIPFADVQKIANSTEKMNADDVVVEERNQVSETNTELVAEETGIDQQQLIYANQKARSLGIDFGKQGLKIIAQYSREILDKVFQHFQFAREHNDIPSPTGWIIRNLQQKWYQNFKPIRYLKSIEERYFELQDLLIGAVGSLPRRLDRPLQLSLFPKKSDTLQK